MIDMLRMKGVHRRMKAEMIFRGREPFNTCHASTMCQLPDGSFVAAWYASRESEGSEDQVIMGCRRDYSEDIWKEAEVWVNVPGRAAGNPVLFVGPDGNLWLMAPANYGEWCRGGTRLFYKRSFDGGKTWEDLELFTEATGVLIKNKPIHLQKENVWLLPAYYEATGSPCFFRIKNSEEFAPLVGVNEISPDVQENLRQPTVVELSNGLLMAYMRSGHQRIYQTLSFDRGKTWSKGEPTELPNPNAGIDMVRLHSGSLALAYNPLIKGRNRLVLSLSEDEGETWAYHIILEDIAPDIRDGNGPPVFSYPATIQARDSRIHITYTYRRRAIKHIVIAEDEIRQGAKNC
jgi:predicted neuraminidase